MHLFKEAALQFREDFRLDDAKSMKPCDYAMEVAALSRDGRKYSLHQYGNHSYMVDVKHTIEIAHDAMQPLTIGDSDWIEENRHGV